jgi:hypothetical protein
MQLCGVRHDFAVMAFAGFDEVEGSLCGELIALFCSFWPGDNLSASFEASMKNCTKEIPHVQLFW